MPYTLWRCLISSRVLLFLLTYESQKHLRLEQVFQSTIPEQIGKLVDRVSMGH